MTISHTVVAWMPAHCYLTPEDLQANTPRVAASLGYTLDSAEMGEHGWTKVGAATITLDLIDRDALLANKVDALRAEKKKVQAEATMRATELEGQIQNLLAITYIPQAADLAAAAGDDDVDEEPPAETVHDQFGDDCPHCDGTGEGAHDGARCFSCKGKGTL